MENKLKTILIIGGAILVSLLVGFNIYYFGYKKAVNTAYQKGVLAGQQQITNFVIGQVENTGRLRVDIAQPDGSTKTIILVPQQ